MRRIIVKITLSTIHFKFNYSIQCLCENRAKLVEVVGINEKSAEGFHNRSAQRFNV